MIILGKISIIFRTATIKGNVGTHLGYIDYKIYNLFIKKNKQKIELKEAEYILNKFFFFQIDKEFFHEKWFHFFYFKEILKGEILFTEEASINCIYLIKEGEIEYTYNNSLLNLSNSLKEICQKLNVRYEVHRYEDNTELNTKLYKELNIPRTFKIMSSHSECMIGSEEYFFNIPKCFHLKVCSKSVKYYEIAKDVTFKLKIRNLNTLLEKMKN